jgi:hypothetical protein
MSPFVHVDAIPVHEGLPSHFDWLLGGHRMPFESFSVHAL